jgi:hypothetical protein
MNSPPRALFIEQKPRLQDSSARLLLSLPLLYASAYFSVTDRTSGSLKIVSSYTLPEGGVTLVMVAFRVPGFFDF